MDGFLTVCAVKPRCHRLKGRCCVSIDPIQVEARVDGKGGAVVIAEPPGELPLGAEIRVEADAVDERAEGAAEEDRSSLLCGKVADMVAEDAVWFLGREEGLWGDDEDGGYVACKEQLA